MAFKFKMGKPITPQPIPSPQVLDDSKDSDNLVAQQVRMAGAEATQVDEMLDGPTPDIRTPDENRKLSRLVDDNFPFDESQVAAIDGTVSGLDEYQITCMTGAAGTGKTTCTKKVVDSLLDLGQLSEVDLDSYWKSDDVESDGDEDYERPERWVPSVAMVGFTGRSTQMIKKNFPRDWHGNIMTIHRMLAFMPVWEEVWDEETQALKNTMRFEPTYDANFKLPWDYVIIDEAGMVGLDLWEQIRVALKASAKVIMIGDINQLPPVHGRSVFGFAMSQFPTFELTHVHRQEGKDNPIVDNAWRVLSGKMPESQGAFQMIKFDGNAAVASKQVRKLLPTLSEKQIYDPIRDTCITPINGEDGARGFHLGQLTLNQEFAIIFNKTDDRFVIDAGREKKRFAIGDKVMATRNDHEIGVTNGMTGVIVDITENAAYTGDTRKYGRLRDVLAYMQEDADDDNIDSEHISLDELHESMDAVMDGMEKKKEKRERGPASHIVTVRFGMGENAVETPFATLAEVASLMTAYVVTCHKMQGGESPVVVIICHDAHKAMLTREWLYTAITRASQRCILLYTEGALRTAIAKQRIVGSTLQQKIKVFKELSAKSIIGARVNVNLSWGGVQLPAPVENKDVGHAVAEELDRLEGETIAPKPEPSEPRTVTIVKVGRVEVQHHHHHAPAPEADDSGRPDPIDGGTIQRDGNPKPFSPEWYALKRQSLAVSGASATPAPALPRPYQPDSRRLYRIAQWYEEVTRPASLMLPKPEPKPTNTAKGLAFLKGKKNG